MKILSIIIYLSLRCYEYTSKISKRMRLRGKVKRLIKTNGAKKLTKQQVHDIKQHFYKNYGIRDLDVRWHQLITATNGHFSLDYVPEDIFYMQMEPKLNNRDLSYALGDKNLLDKLFPMAKQPETVVKCINGFFYVEGELCTKEKAITRCGTETQTMFIKPSLGSYGGKNVCKFSMINGLVSPDNISLEQLFKTYGSNFIVQKGVFQHEAMNALNPTSVNTFRTHSYLNDSDVTVLDVVVRMGRKGAQIDNSSQGGLTCGVQKNGQLNKVGYFLNGDKCFATDGGQLFEAIKLPYMDKIYTMAQTLHKQAPHFAFISWDFCLDTNGDVVLIEYNIQGQDIISCQMNNGPILAPILDILKI